MTDHIMGELAAQSEREGMQGAMPEGGGAGQFNSKVPNAVGGGNAQMNDIMPDRVQGGEQQRVNNPGV